MILVVGATGMLGGQIVRLLRAKDRPVRILVRPGASFQDLVEAGAQPVSGDLKQPETLAGALRGVEVVVTTANSALRGGADNLENVDLTGNRNLIEAAKKAGVGQFVFVSALGAREDSPSPFMRAKSASERHLQQSGMRYTILQPNLFMDVWIGAIVGAPVASGQPVTIIGQGQRRHSMVAVADVAALAASAVGHPAAERTTVLIGGPQPISWREVVATCERLTGKRIPLTTLTPGQKLPGLPDSMTELMTTLDTYDSPIEMTETAARFGLTLTTVETFARKMLAG
jgi:uncharacterized protein YbjT (DUF2867 family)